MFLLARYGRREATETNAYKNFTWARRNVHQTENSYRVKASADSAFLFFSLVSSYSCDRITTGRFSPNSNEKCAERVTLIDEAVTVWLRRLVCISKNTHTIRRTAVVFLEHGSTRTRSHERATDYNKITSIDRWGDGRYEAYA